MRTVGVLGGMGPWATLDFMAKALKAGEGASEQDNLRLIVDCNPKVLDRNAALGGNGPSPGPTLAAMARGLEAAGADFLVMACNAAHAWQGEIEAATALPFASIIEETCRWLAERDPPGRRIGLMGADACLSADLYQKALTAVGLTAVTPTPAVQAPPSVNPLSTTPLPSRSSSTRTSDSLVVRCTRALRLTPCPLVSSPQVKPAGRPSSRRRCQCSPEASRADRSRESTRRG